MITEKYLKQIKRLVFPHLDKNAKVFIFGSALDEGQFADVDIGIMDTQISEEKINMIKEDFENSLFPYKIDLIDFSKVEIKFKNKVFKNKTLCLT